MLRSDYYLLWNEFLHACSFHKTIYDKVLILVVYICVNAWYFGVPKSFFCYFWRLIFFF